MDNYCGENFFIVRQQKTANSIEWKEIRFVYKFRGIQIQKRWPNGQMFVNLSSNDIMNG